GHAHPPRPNTGQITAKSPADAKKRRTGHTLVAEDGTGLLGFVISLRHGAVRAGERPSASIPGRMLPLLFLTTWPAVLLPCGEFLPARGPMKFLCVSTLAILAACASGSKIGSTPTSCVGNFVAGDLVITEVMANPAGADAGKEWFEVKSTRNATIELN